MDEISLLKEIAYYSKIVKSYENTSVGPRYNYKRCPTSTKMPPSSNQFRLNNLNKQQAPRKPDPDKNKYFYVNPSNQNQNTPPATAAVSSSITVLINPNFKQNVHINPHFKPSTVLTTTTTVHVNPKHFPQTVVKRAVFIENPVNDQITATTNNPLHQVPASTSRTVIVTPTKLVKCHKNTNKTVPAKRAINETNSVRSKYKLVRKTDVKSSGNRYKLDRRTATASTGKKRLSTSFKSPLNTAFRSRFKYINRSLNSNHSLVRINGKIFKKIDAFNGVKGKAVTNAWSSCKMDVKSVSKKKLISISGQLYHMNTNRRTLNMVQKEDGKKRMVVTSLKMNSANTLNKQRKRFFVLQARQKSIGTLVNRMQKNNIPCLLYRKFGRCKGHEKGTCRKVHNPNQVGLCPKFLQGACLKEKCLLSHKVSAEKMPTCRFFLEGMCTKENCPYLHVKINRKADVCQDFLEGFCRDADKCNKRHQYLCPEFEKHGSCKKRKCRFPHNGSSAKNAKTATGKPKSARKTKQVSIPRASSASVASAEVAGKVAGTSDVPENARYYVTDRNASEETDNSVSISATNRTNDTDADVQDARPKLGVLPSFIPFFNT